MSRERDVPIHLYGSKNSAMDGIAGFRLYIEGMKPDSVRALIATKAICERYLCGECSLEIVDIQREPDRASEDGITILPTLVKLWPSPVISVSEEFENTEQVLDILDLHDCSRKIGDPSLT